MTKITVIGLRGIPNVMGGVETHCEELLPLIVQSHPDMRITVIGRRPFVTEDGEFKGLAVTSVYAPRGKNTEAIVATLLSILKARREGCDLLHFHAIGPALLTPMARLLGMRVVLTHHGEDYQRAKWGGIAKLSLRLGEWLGTRFSDRVITVSPSLQRHLRGKYPAKADSIRYIPNGISPLAGDAASDAALLNEFGLARGGFLLVAARLVPEKGIDYLLEAHRKSGSKMPLVVAGSAMHGSEYADGLIASAGAEVIFTGMLPRTKLAALYRNTALFVLPSFHEGLPISALEAISTGAPILMSDIDANTDIGLPSEHYFPVGDTQALAQRLAASDFTDLDTTDWKGAANFDWPRIAKKTAELYREVC